MKSYLETTRQIVDDDASFDPCNTPREIRLLLNLHQVQNHQEKQLADIQEEVTEATEGAK